MSLASRRWALLSVSDKTGVVELAQELRALGFDILSTGGTAKLLGEHAVEVTEVAQHTGFPEILDGRVKTLHPRIHSGLLAHRPDPAHMRALADHAIDPIEVLVVNLYPFERTVAHAECSFDDAIENIDIGGPAMLRAAAKNHQNVAVLVDPADYELVLNQLRSANSVDARTRLALAKKVFAHTARYDGAIADYLTSLDSDGTRQTFPEVLSRQWFKAQQMRYGENPHQQAAFYREKTVGAGLLAGFSQLQGKELSYNNIADADAAWECARSFDQSACVIVKHANPCGVAIAMAANDAYLKALKTDPTSAFGGVIAFNCAVDATTAQSVSRQFVELVIAPEFTAEARAVFDGKPNVRLLAVRVGDAHNDFDFKRVGGGVLVQIPDDHALQMSDLRTVTAKKPTTQQVDDMMFAWKVAKFVKSNAIVFACDGATLGIGAGQMSRVDSARIASIKAGTAKLSLGGSAAASDAFFPFRDGLDVLIDAGAECVIQPGGSVRDDEVIAAANERAVAMVFTGVRHFRH
ncbi:MAG TPA: bifunctional phosphoribosylaminoimidazolecarboxamide formyltransferase/IMP cyclohydrolase [Burkholderiaceae bacterium]|nr:bifunctional phosphoribosylaminoimidazolecarboxamide formyltransferase/IMP cyclohydrolase [Burkholderiaceae bacterium]